jgi:hypothetical protein
VPVDARGVRPNVVTVLTGGTDDEIQGGGRFELEESKGEASDMEEGWNLTEAERHRWGLGFGP